VEQHVKSKWTELGGRCKNPHSDAPAHVEHYRCVVVPVVPTAGVGGDVAHG